MCPCVATFVLVSSFLMFQMHKHTLIAFGFQVGIFLLCQRPSCWKCHWNIVFLNRSHVCSSATILVRPSCRLRYFLLLLDEKQANKNNHNDDSDEEVQTTKKLNETSVSTITRDVPICAVNTKTHGLEPVCTQAKRRFALTHMRAPIYICIQRKCIHGKVIKKTNNAKSTTKHNDCKVNPHGSNDGSSSSERKKIPTTVQLKNTHLRRGASARAQHRAS